MYKPYLKLFPLPIALMFAILAGCGNLSQVSEPLNNGEGIALLKITAAAGGPFQKLAKKSSLIISASDILTMTKNLTVTDSGVEGTITGIPAGKNRLFTVSVYDSLQILQYRGSSTADVIADSAVIITISVSRVSGAAIINGIVTDTLVPKWTFFDGFESSTLNPAWSQISTGSISFVTNIKHQGAQAIKIHECAPAQTWVYLVCNFQSPMSTGKLSWFWYDEAAGASIDYDGFAIKYRCTATDTGRIFIWVGDNIQTFTPHYNIFSDGCTPVSFDSIFGTRSIGWHSWDVDKYADSVIFRLDGAKVLTKYMPYDLISFSIGNYAYSAACASEYSTIVDSLYIVAY